MKANAASLLIFHIKEVPGACASGSRVPWVFTELTQAKGAETQLLPDQQHLPCAAPREVRMPSACPRLGQGMLQELCGVHTRIQPDHPFPSMDQVCVG